MSFAAARPNARHGLSEAAVYAVDYHFWPSPILVVAGACGMNDVLRKNVNFKDFGKGFLDEYLANGMSTLSKRQIDVLVMHLLEVHGGDLTPFLGPP